LPAARTRRHPARLRRSAQIPKRLYRRAEVAMKGGR
jgi:hypothetical protein